MTTPISDAASDPNAWNELATGFKPWPFVMLSNESLLYLAGSGEERLNYFVGQRAAIRLGDSQTEPVYALRRRDGNERRHLRPIRSTDLISVPATSTATETIEFAPAEPKEASTAASAPTHRWRPPTSTRLPAGRISMLVRRRPLSSDPRPRRNRPQRELSAASAASCFRC